jgi:hypothetical protein
MLKQTIIPLLLLTIFAACNSAEREAAMTALTAAADSTSFSADVKDLQSPSRKIVRTADINCRVADVNQTVAKLETITRSLNGMIMDSRTENRIDDVKTLDYKTDSLKQVRVYTTTAYLTLKVPVQHTDSVMAMIPSLVSFIENRNLQQEDKTWAYLSNAMKNEIAKTAPQTTPLKDVEAIACEDSKKELVVDRKMENMQLLDDVNYATVTLQLFQPAKMDALVIINPNTATTLPLGRELVLALQGGYEMGKNILLVCVQLWPLWLLLAMGLFLYRKMRNAKLTT